MQVVGAVLVHLLQHPAGVVAQGLLAAGGMAVPLVVQRGWAGVRAVQPAQATLQQLQVGVLAHHLAMLEILAAQAFLVAAGVVPALGLQAALPVYLAVQVALAAQPPQLPLAVQQVLQAARVQACLMALAVAGAGAVIAHLPLARLAGMAARRAAAAGVAAAALQQAGQAGQAGAVKYGFGSGKMPTEKRYKIVLTQARQMGDEMLPVGSVINIIVWDGATPYAPEEGTELVEE